jgi:hypothetical protein
LVPPKATRSATDADTVQAETARSQEGLGSPTASADLSLRGRRDIKEVLIFRCILLFQLAAFRMLRNLKQACILSRERQHATICRYCWGKSRPEVQKKAPTTMRLSAQKSQ